MVFRVRPVDAPPAVTLTVARSESKAAVELRQVGIFQTDEMKFALFGKFGARTGIAIRDAAASAEASAKAALGKACCR